MIIDCHGHYTTTPPGVGEWRNAQVDAVTADASFVGTKGSMRVTDDEIRDSIENNQLKLQRERGTDLTLFSPRASWMAHHIGNRHTSRFWTEHQNELIRRVCDLYPSSFAPVAQLPQSPGLAPSELITEMRRCVQEMGFVGLNLSPDTSGGYWQDARLDDASWYPFYEAMVDLDVPAMIHVSTACNPCFSATGSHYLGADTTAFDQLMYSKLFDDFPTLRFVIPHGGGAVPYHWGRFRGLAQDKELGDLHEVMLNNVYFDTCVYHQPGIDLLLDVIPVKNILFASEMIGAVRGIDPTTGYYFDDTKRYIDNNSSLTDVDRYQIFEGNVRRVYPRLQI